MIYKKKIFERRNKFIKCIREEEIQCLGDDTITLELLGKGIVDKLRKDYSFCHLGLITIAIKGLRRKGLGTKTLVHIYDDSWIDMGKAMIASIEIDMNNNIGIVYCMPDFMMSLKDLQQDIKIGIKTKGYEQQVKGSNCDAPNPGCPLTTRQPAKNLNVSYRETYTRVIMSTWAPASILIKIYPTIFQ